MVKVFGATTRWARRVNATGRIAFFIEADFFHKICIISFSIGWTRRWSCLRMNFIFDFKDNFMNFPVLWGYRIKKKRFSLMYNMTISCRIMYAGPEELWGAPKIQ